MGEDRRRPLRVEFDPRLRLEFHGSRVTSDAGLLAYRELDDVLGLTERAAEALIDPRTGRNIQHDLVGLLRQSVYSRLAGYPDLNDAERLSQDPAMRTVVSRRAFDKTAASTSEMARFETEILSQEENLGGLAELNSEWVRTAMGRTSYRKIILDMDSSESPVFGHQEGSAYNGHFGSTCYHPLFCFNQYGDLEGTMLREGNVHSADHWRDLLDPVVDRYKGEKIRKYFRADAAFAKPEIYEYLEEKGYRYAIRIPANEVLQAEIEHLLTRPVGRPPKEPVVFHDEFRYKADSWDRSRRVVAKVEWHAGELFPRVGFIVTNLTANPEGVVKYYNGRGTAEQWIKEGKYALEWTRLSCHGFADNQARLQLFALAYNLGNFLRRFALPQSVGQWTLTTMKEKLIKIGAKVVRHARMVTFQMAEVAVPRRLFLWILARIGRLRASPG